MATLSVPPIIEYGVAGYVVPGQTESGDRHLIRHRPEGVLVAAIDGLGHGDEAACAAKMALSILEGSREESVVNLLQLCHEGLRSTRGVVMSLATIDLTRGSMSWIGVGNVQGVILRRRARVGAVPEELLLRAGVIGAQLPGLQAASLRLTKGDTLIFATDGIRTEFAKDLPPAEAPQKLADKILAEYCRGNDDALVVVTRYPENQT
jgi:negative regulator of sigma-B (phosphoserine phosphatase)